MSQQENGVEPKWYVVHTYSGYENKVKTDLEKTVKNRELEEYFFEIVVPMEEQIEIKDGKKKTNLKKVFPGYVLVEMIMSDESWYIVRNTPGVTGFLGSSGKGAKPVPLYDEEVERIFKMAKFSSDEAVTRFAKKLRKMGIDDKLVEMGAETGDCVRILDFYFDFRD